MAHRANESMFSSIHEAIRRDLSAGLSDQLVGAQLTREGMGPEVEAELEASAHLLAEKLKKNSRRMLKDRRARTRGFERRNFKRWKPAFDQIDIVWNASEEIGREFDKEFRPGAADDQDHTFEALTRLHGRALLVAAEAIHLMKGGFADGALSRWRTLHELLVVAVFILNHGKSAAYRYLVSVEFEKKSIAMRVNAYASRANLEPFTDDQILTLENRCRDIQAELGREMKEEYGWARPQFPQKQPKDRVRFSDIEESVGLDHWRPRFQFASQHSHAGYMESSSLLAMSEAERDLILVGPSNSGLVEPLQMTAMHIASMTSTLLITRTTLDTMLMCNCITILSNEVVELALRAEQLSAANYAKQNATDVD